MMSNGKMRFIVVLAALLTGGFLVTSVVSYFVAHDSLTDQIAESTLPLTSDNVYSEIQRDMLRPIFISSLMAQDTFLRDWYLEGERDAGRVIKYLKEIQDRYGTVTSYFISDKTRNYYHPTGINRKVLESNPEDSWYFHARKIKDAYEVNLDTDQVNNRALTVFINYKVFDYDGNFIGITGVGLGVDAVKTLIDTYQRRYGRTIYFTTREGKVTLRGADYKGYGDLRSEPGLSPLATRILASPSGSYTFERGGKTVYLNSRVVPEFNWYLLIEQEDNTDQGRIIQTLRVNIALSFLVTLVVMFLAHMTFRSYQSRLERMATTDPLTGATTRHAFDQLFEQTTKSGRRRGKTTAAIMLDLDDFKKVNDTNGHVAGDEVLRGVVERIRAGVRESDILCRWGGEEFLVLLPECDLEGARALGEKVRAGIAREPIAFHGGKATLTASIGVAVLQEGEDQDGLVRRVDAALYGAKKGGRNRVEAAG